jgi:hypothetical protein
MKATENERQGQPRTQEYQVANAIPMYRLRCFARALDFHLPSAGIVVISSILHMVLHLLNLLALLTIPVVYRFMVLIHFVLSSSKSSSFLATSWIPGAGATRLWTKVLNRTTCMYVFVMTLEVSMAVECKAVTIVKAGFVETSELACEGDLANDRVRTRGWRVRCATPASIQVL